MVAEGSSRCESAVFAVLVHNFLCARVRKVVIKTAKTTIPQVTQLRSPSRRSPTTPQRPPSCPTPGRRPGKAVGSQARRPEGPTCAGGRPQHDDISPHMRPRPSPPPNLFKLGQTRTRPKGAIPRSPDLSAVADTVVSRGMRRLAPRVGALARPADLERRPKTMSSNLASRRLSQLALKPGDMWSTKQNGCTLS